MTVVITGASSGIGKATAEAFVGAGHSVYSLSRTKCGVEGVVTVPCDITDSEQVKSAIGKIDEIDILINNAGFGISGAVEFTEMSEMKGQFELNFFATVAVTREAMPKLKASHGKVIFISSAASVFSIPFQSFYSATKSAVESVAFALKNELKAFHVQVGVVRLGDIKTNFTAKRQKSFKGDDVYGGMISRSVAVMEHDEQNGMSPATVGKAVLKVATKKKLKLVTTVGAQYKFLCALSKVLPQSLINTVVGAMYMPKK